jgi:hypothetical protein
LPDDWRDVKQVDLYRITLAGSVPLKKAVPIILGTVVLSLEKDEGIAIVPTMQTLGYCQTAVSSGNFMS